MASKVIIVYFSPTNTTKTVVKQIVKGYNPEVIQEIDLTDDIDVEIEIKDAIVVFGAPVYRGRIPVEASEKLSKICGNNSKAVAVAVYGNRHFDDALIELKDIIEEQGFKTIAAATFIGEHSFSTEQFPIAVSRPDLSDLQKAEQFGVQIRSLISSSEDLEKTLIVPGNQPYKELGESPDVSPVTDEQKCDMCGICSDVCPTNAITVNGGVKTDEKQCILCCACVKSCPNEARYNDSEMVHIAATRLSEACKERKEPELFINE